MSIGPLLVGGLGGSFTTSIPLFLTFGLRIAPDNTASLNAGARSIIPTGPYMVESVLADNQFGALSSIGENYAILCFIVDGPHMVQSEITENLFGAEGLI